MSSSVNPSVGPSGRFTKMSTIQPSWVTDTNSTYVRAVRRRPGSCFAARSQSAIVATRMTT